MVSHLRLVIVAISLAPAAALQAGDAYLPADDEVLEVLPKSVLAERDELAELRQRLTANPRDADLAAQVAQRYQEIGKSGGGPRYYGYARAAIAAWWDAPDAPAEILRVRAKLKENNHEYQAALADIDALIEQSPQDTQAWVERVNLLRVTGQYDRARGAIEEMSSFAGGVARVFCEAPLMAVTGRAEEAADVFDQALPVTRVNLPDVLPWMLTSRAEIARSLGDDEKAEAYYRQGLKADPGFNSLKRDYADFLLDRDRAGEALTMIGEDLSDNGLLLAAAIAAQQSGKSELAQRLKAQLADRFSETRLRGDKPHGRFESRYALELENNPRRALELALENWQAQKELRDSRNVLEAALAAGQPEAAATVIAFLESAGTQDVTLARLVRELEDR